MVRFNPPVVVNVDVAIVKLIPAPVAPIASGEPGVVVPMPTSVLKRFCIVEEPLV